MTEVSPVSAVLITWQRCETLLATLARLVALDPPLAEIIVVDNGSVDGTAAAVRAQFPQVILLRRERNAGIDAYNDGFRRATQAYLLILDDDSYPAPDAVARAAARLQAQPRTAAVAFRITDAVTGADARYWFLPAGDRPCPATAFVGCGALVRRNALLAAGGYAREFFLYENEVELCLRLRLAGQNIEYCPECVAHHPSSVRRGTPNMIYYGTKNKLLTVWRFLPPRRALALTAEFLLTNCYLTLRFGHAVRRWQAVLQALRDWDSYRTRTLPRPLTSDEQELLAPLVDELRLSVWMKR
ncbi:MAG TPA: glycosyltransferase family 2 protein [bacterium]|nr:glycosyltransferase family 2 protein [bacterium]